jgi:hypothetical protein
MFILALLILLFAGGIGFAVLTGPAARNVRFELALFATAFLLRVLAAVAVYVGGLVNLLGDEDGALWEFGEILAARWSWLGFWEMLADAQTDLSERQNRGYYVFLGLIFTCLGHSSRMIAASINAWVGSLTTVLSYRLTLTAFGEPAAARRAGVLACVMPSLIIWSAQTLKEPIVIFLETLILYKAIQLRRSRSLSATLTICAAMCVLTTFRFYAGYLIAGALGLALLLAARGVWPRVMAGLLIASFLLIVTRSGISRSHTETFDRFGLSYIEAHRRAISRGGEYYGTRSAVLVSEKLDSVSQIGIATTVGLAHLIFAPFPWQFATGSLRMLATLPDTLLWWVLVWWGLIPGLRAALRDHRAEAITLLTFCTALALIYSVMFANVGLVFRQRAQLIPLLLAFIGLGLYRRHIPRHLTGHGHGRGVVKTPVRSNWAFPPEREGPIPR